MNIDLSNENWWKDLSKVELFTAVSELYDCRCEWMENVLGTDGSRIIITPNGDMKGIPDPATSYIYDSANGKPFYMLGGVHIILDLTTFEWIS